MISGGCHQKVYGKVLQSKGTAVTGPDREGQCGYSISCKGNRALNAD